MYKIPNTTRSDGYSCIKDKDSSIGGFDGWEDCTDFACEKQLYEINNQLIKSVCSKVSLDHLFKTKYKLDFYERYSPSGWCFVTNCPFPHHRDSDPSFHYNKEDDRFFCFGCKKGGRAVHFVSYMEKITISKSIDILINNFDLLNKLDIVKDNSNNESEIDELLLSFSEDLNEYLRKNGSTKKDISFIETLSWSVDIYLNKNLPTKSLDLNNLAERINILKSKLKQDV